MMVFGAASNFSYTGTCVKVCETCPGDKLGHLGIVDYCLLVLVLVVSMGIGVFYIIQEYRMSRQATSEDVLMGGRDMGTFPISMSLLASFMSAITVLGMPTEMYNVNTAYWLNGLAMIPTTIITNHVFLPFFHKLNFTSAYEYLEVRFSFAVRACASVMFVILMVMYMGVVLYAPSLALNAVTELPLWACIVSIGLVCTFYTALGGLKAVVWSDTFQTFVVIAGLIAVIVRGTDEVGGLGEVWRIADRGGRIFFFDWSFDPTVRHSTWSLLIGSMTSQLTIYAANQTMIQRYLSIRSTYQSKKALYMSLPFSVLISTLVCVVGLIIYASYSQCDPYLAGVVRARDQLLPLLVMDKLTVAPGLAGLFVACLFSASLSSISSGLNALAIVILEDLIKPYWAWRRVAIKPSTTGTVAKAIGLSGGAIVIGLAFAFSQLGQTVLQIMMSIFGMVGGPLLGLFLCGIFFPYIEAQGALWGFLSSSFISFWMGIGATVVVPVPPVINVGTESCYNQELLNYKCAHGKLPDNSSVLEDLVRLGSQRQAMTSNSTQSHSLESNGADLWLYHVSYLWYALVAVIVHLVVSHVVTLIASYCKGAVGPEDVESNLIHSAVDRVCCYWTLACRRVDRTNSKGERIDGPHVHTENVEPQVSIVTKTAMVYGGGDEGLYSVTKGQDNPAYIADLLIDQANVKDQPSVQNPLNAKDLMELSQSKLDACLGVTRL